MNQVLRDSVAVSNESSLGSWMVAQQLPVVPLRGTLYSITVAEAKSGHGETGMRWSPSRNQQLSVTPNE